jgi:hypothetical protein
LLRRLPRTARTAIRAAGHWLLPALPRGQYVLLSARPPILVVWDYALEDRRALFFDLIRSLAPFRPHLFYWPSWHVSHEHLEGHLQRLRWLAGACPSASVTVMGATPAEAALFAARGVDALHCNHNALADERVFQPLPPAEKPFDAIYDAKLEPYKRHSLAARVPRLALLGYRNPRTGDRRFAARVLRELSGAHWLNDPTATPAQWQLADVDVNLAYNRCRTGLCLSAIEGPMWASIQYLLAGLPVVSTPSDGGRDQFFAPPHVCVVPPTPEAVAAAVQELAAARLDPWEIRSRTLELMAPHRERFTSTVQRLLDAAGEPRHFIGNWRQVIPHRVVDMRLVGRRKRREIAAHNGQIRAAVRAGQAVARAQAVPLPADS